MNYTDFLNRVIDDGIQAARADYADPKDAHKLEGAVAGFEACRGLDPHLLTSLLVAARNKREAIYREQAGVDESEDALRAYWWQVCFEAEVEWVCNVVSVWLRHNGQDQIVAPTARGAAKALSILGAA